MCLWVRYFSIVMHRSEKNWVFIYLDTWRHKMSKWWVISIGPHRVKFINSVVKINVFEKKSRLSSIGSSPSCCRKIWINSLRPGDAIWRQTSRSTLIQALACRLYAAYPLPEPILTHFQFWRTHLSQIELKYQNSQIYFKSQFASFQPFCLCLNLLLH